jgi:octaprenyl-diphosphate synthase
LTVATLAGAPAEVQVGLGLVEESLKRQAESQIELAARVGETTLRAGGKRVRPALAIVAGLACDPSTPIERLARLASSLELVHMATLVHDDVIDGSDLRRGRPTARAVVGAEAAVLAGDVLLAKAMRILAEDGDIEIIRMVSNAVVALAEGEVMEIEVRGDFDLPRASINQVVELKTASLLRCSCMVGAATAGAGAEAMDALATFGGKVGHAFQLIDDVLDYEGDPSQTGKPAGQDFREGQCTEPLALFRERASRDDVAFARAVFGKPEGGEALEQVVAAMERHGCLADARQAARDLLAQALDSLAPLPVSPFRDTLADTACALAERTR